MTDKFTNELNFRTGPWGTRSYWDLTKPPVTFVYQVNLSTFGAWGTKPIEDITKQYIAAIESELEEFAIAGAMFYPGHRVSVMLIYTPLNPWPRIN